MILLQPLTSEDVMLKLVGKHKTTYSKMEDGDRYKVELYLEDGYFYVEGHIAFKMFKSVPMHGHTYAEGVYQSWLDRAQGKAIHGRVDNPKIGPLRGV
jgi:hypothetical protein